MLADSTDKPQQGQSFLSKFDIFFGQRAFFYVRRNAEQTSNVSGVLTIIMIILLVLITGSFGYKMISRKIVTIKYNTFDNLEEGTELNPSNFMFAVGFEGLSLLHR